MKVRWSLAPPRTTCTRLRLQLGESLAVMGAAHVAVERSTTLANPPDESRRNSRDQAMRRDVLGDNRAGGNHRIPSDRDAANNRSVGADRRSVLDLRLHELPIRAHGPRIKVIREANVGSDEDAIADRDPSVYRREILHLAVVADPNVGVDVDILPDDTILTDMGPFSDLRPMPNATPVSHHRVCGHLRSRVNPGGHRDPNSAPGSSTFPVRVAKRDGSAGSDDQTSGGKPDNEPDDVRGNPDQGDDDDGVAGLEAEAR